MKLNFKRISVIVNIIFVLIMFPINAMADTSKPEKLLVIGDSISYGYGLKGTENTSKSYGNLLAHALNLSTASYENISVNGAASSDILKNVKNSQDIISDSDTVILSIGGNDILGLFITDMQNSLELTNNPTQQEVMAALQDKNRISSATTRFVKSNALQKYIDAVNKFDKNYIQVINEIKKDNPAAKLYIQTIYNPFGGIDDLKEISSFAEVPIGKMNDVIMSNRDKLDYKVINVYTAFSGKAKIYTNIVNFDIHPNEAGHNVIFNEAYKAITDKDYQQKAVSVMKVHKRNKYDKIFFLYQYKWFILAFLIAIIILFVFLIRKHNKKFHKKR